MDTGRSYYFHSDFAEPPDACGAILVGRDWYDITAWHLSADGRCTKCGTCCQGVFEADAGC